MGRTDDLVAANRDAHDSIAASYAAMHREIYNDVEQLRVRQALARARDLVVRGGGALRALDFGSGDGNLTDKLIEMGLEVTSADVGGLFLDRLEARHSHTARWRRLDLNGIDLRELQTESYDLVCAYSVLHHVPDYLRAVREFARVVAVGGVVYIDLECSPSYWTPSAEYKAYEQLWNPPRTVWGKMANLFSADWYRLKARQIRNPRYQPEGDIHVWPDDHIEWDRVETELRQGGCSVVDVEDYLLYRPQVSDADYRRYAAKCSDRRRLVAKKVASDEPTAARRSG